MTALLDVLLRTIDWSNERTSVGSGESVPRAVLGLASAGSDEDADVWYWELDNRVVVQGQLFGAAVALVPALLVALMSSVSESARFWLMELVMQIAAGESHTSELDSELGVAARRAFGEGLWILYAQLEDESPRVRATAVDLLAIADPDSDRAVAIVLAQLAADSSEEVQRAIARLVRRLVAPTSPLDDLAQSSGILPAVRATLESDR